MRIAKLAMVLAIVAASCPAFASVMLIDKTATWGLSSGGALVASGSNVYYITGTTVREYVKSTDSWSTLSVTANGCNGFTGSDSGDPSPLLSVSGGKIIVLRNGSGGASQAVNMFDTNTNTWTNITSSAMSSGSYAFGWGQRGVYDVKNNQVYFFWSNSTYSSQGLYSVYNVSAGTWTTPVTFSSWSSDIWNQMGNATVVNGTTYTNYSLMESAVENGATAIALTVDDISSGVTLPTSTSSTPTSTLGVSVASGRVLGAQMLATYGTDVYIAGAGTCGNLVVYHQATQTWELLSTFTNNSGGGQFDGGLRHSIAIANGTLVVTDGGQFWSATLVPEPATLALLALGGLGMILRRRK